MQETQEMQVQSLGEEDPLEEEMSAHSSGTHLSNWTATTTELDWGLRKSLGLSLMAGGQAGLPSPLLAQLTAWRETLALTWTPAALHLMDAKWVRLIIPANWDHLEVWFCHQSFLLSLPAVCQL